MIVLWCHHDMLQQINELIGELILTSSVTTCVADMERHKRAEVHVILLFRCAVAHSETYNLAVGLFAILNVS